MHNRILEKGLDVPNTKLISDLRNCAAVLETVSDWKAFIFENIGK